MSTYLEMEFVETAAEIDLLRVNVGVVLQRLAQVDQLLVSFDSVQTFQGQLFLVDKVLKVLLDLKDVELNSLDQTLAAETVKIAPGK